MVEFTKMHGLSNDFVIFNEGARADSFPRDRLSQIASRRLGVGCDQLVFVHPPENHGAQAFMRIFNADGSEAEACGNATRCVASLLMKRGNRDIVVIETVAGHLTCTARDGDRDFVTVDMGVPKTGWRDIPLARDADTLRIPLEVADLGEPVGVSMGNPHCVFFVSDVEGVDIARLGPAVETDPLFPKKTNVEFAQILDRSRIRMRVWERGVGITAACGSGACATVVAAALRGLADRRCDVELDGGTLGIEWRADDDHLLMSGPVAYVFRGELFQ